MLTGFDLCRAVLAVLDITAPEQSVLTVLAIMANDDAQCWPPIKGPTGLTGKTKLSERAVQRAIARLADLGHLTRCERPGRGCVYTVHPRQCGTPGGETPRQTAAPATEPETPGSVAPKQPVTTKPLKASPPKVARARAAATGVPANFRPSPSAGSITAKVMEEWPPGLLDEQIEHFIDHHTAAGTKSLDWQASWRTWAKNWKRFNGQRNHNHRREDPIFTARRNLGRDD